MRYIGGKIASCILNSHWRPGLTDTCVHLCPIPSHTSFTARSSCMHMRGIFSHVGNQCDNVRSLKLLNSYGMWLTPSINLEIMKVMSAWIFVTLTRYCHIGSQRERVPNKEEFPHMCGHEDWAEKEAWEGQGPTEWRCDLARGVSDTKYHF
jgi:hypothetical protein